MKFKSVYLLSQTERRALSLAFAPGATVLRAGNGFGKSALLKSLYETFGAEPHHVDRSWKEANVASAVEFAIDGGSYTILKFGGTYAVFDHDGRKQFQATSVTQQLAPFLAEMLDFRLLMTDQRENVLVPPPAYAFAPFYVDQDKSWSSAWEPFRGMYLPRSAATLADYHSGLKPNDYYVAQAERDRLAAGLREAETRRRGLAEAVEHLRQVAVTTQVHFDLDDFQIETQSLLRESQQLHEQQADHRAALTELVEARALWSAQASVARAALAEFEDVFRSATGHPVDVECPTCGEHYLNDIAARFHIAADAETLIAALHHAQSEEQNLTKKIENARGAVDEIAAAIGRVQAILSVRRKDISLAEVVAAEGRNSATRVLREKVNEVDASIGSINSQMEQFSAEMRRSLDRKRSREIKDYFGARLTDFARTLDVRVDGDPAGSLSATQHARGSEGPRGLAAYYYAFLHTVRGFGTSAFCPIVVDAPNQQGQDGEHLPTIISFLVNQRPKEAQLILGVEEPVGITENDASIIEVGVAKRQLLSSSQFEPVSEHLRPYLAQLVI
jgi:uncharacterized Zn finger protein (UPF0148 family)